MLILGSVMVYRSYNGVRIMEVSAVNNVRVNFYVMSKCPDAQLCETRFAPTLIKLASIINFTVNYIARESKQNELLCMHGADECLGNKQQLCVQSLTTQTNLLTFLQCQSNTMQSIPSNDEVCAKDINLKYSDLQACVQTAGDRLLHKSIQQTRLANVQKSCTMFINNKFWCQHDGTWNGCAEGKDPVDLIRSVCSRYSGKNKPIECSTTINNVRG